MKMQKMRTWMFAATLFASVFALAADINSVIVQGYVRSTSGTPISSATAQTVTFVLASGGSTIKTWAGQSVTFTNGLFSHTLTGITAGEIAAFAAASGSATSITVSSSTGEFASTPLSLPLPSAAVPTALQAASLHSSAKATTSAGAADVGKAVVLDAGGKIDATMIGALPAISGANLTGLTAANISGTLDAATLPAATAAAAGAVDTGAQAFAGAKTFNDTVAMGNGLGVTGTATVSGLSTLNGGAKFGAAPGDSTLTHYEEAGTCDLTAKGLTAAGTFTQASEVCRYSRIGKVVTMNVYLSQTSLTGGTGGYAWTGLPYAASSAAGFEQVCSILGETTLAHPINNIIIAAIQPGESQIRFYTRLVTAASTKAALAADTGTAGASVSCTYFVD